MNVTEETLKDLLDQLQVQLATIEAARIKIQEITAHIEGKNPDPPKIAPSP